MPRKNRSETVVREPEKGLQEKDHNEEVDVLQGNEDEFDCSSLHSVLSQIACEDRLAAKKQTRNATVISDNEV